MQLLSLAKPLSILLFICVQSQLVHAVVFKYEEIRKSSARYRQRFAVIVDLEFSHDRSDNKFRSHHIGDRDHFVPGQRLESMQKWVEQNHESSRYRHPSRFADEARVWKNTLHYIQDDDSASFPRGEDTIERGGARCGGFARLAYEWAEEWGQYAEVIRMDTAGSPVAHAIAVVLDNDQYYLVNSGSYYRLNDAHDIEQARKQAVALASETLNWSYNAVTWERMDFDSQRDTFVKAGHDKYQGSGLVEAGQHVDSPLNGQTYKYSEGGEDFSSDDQENGKDFDTPRGQKNLPSTVKLVSAKKKKTLPTGIMPPTVKRVR